MSVPIDRRFVLRAAGAALALLGHRRGELLQQELGWLVAPAHRDVWGRALGAAGAMLSSWGADSDAHPLRAPTPPAAPVEPPPPAKRRGMFKR